MNKTEFITEIAEKVGVSKKQADEFVKAFIDTITEELVSGGEVVFTGFGKFSVTDVAEKTGTIQLGDRKGETYTTPAHVKPCFKYLSAVKNAVKGK